MSYSFNVRAGTKAEVLEKVAAELNQAVADQPIHSADREQAEAAASAFLGILPEVDDKDYFISVNGSVGYQGEGEERVITTASVGVSASLIAKEVEKAPPAKAKETDDGA